MARSTVSFFHEADADGADVLSARLNAEVIDLSGFRPSPPAGTLEVHLGAG